MTRKTITAGAYVAAAVLSLAVAPRSLGQAAPAAPATGTPAATDEEMVVLSPFVVNASEDSGYTATATLAGTRIRTELKDVGSAISVVTEQFMKDTGATNSESLLKFTTNTEVGGMYGNFTGAGNGAIVDTTPQRVAPNANTRVRGLAQADNTRDFFLTEIPWDSYIVGRVDLQRGPNSILFGLGSPAGVINASVNGAAFKDTATIEGRFGSYGSYRGSFDANKVLLADELAVRVDGLYDHQHYRQKPAYQTDSRYFGALRWDPKFLRTDSARTSFKISYENGDIRANRPRTTPPVDLITPWFQPVTSNPLTSGMGKLLVDPRTVGDSYRTAVEAARAAGDYGFGARQRTYNDAFSNANYNPWVGSAGRLYDNIAFFFPDPDSAGYTAAITGSIAARNTPAGEWGSIRSLPWTVFSGIQPFDAYAGVALSDGRNGLYKAKYITDPSIFDFYNILLDGPTKREWQKFDALNAALSQTFFNNKLGFEVVYDTQSYKEGQVQLLNGFAQGITVDINRTFTDGTPNPNAGRPMVISDSSGNRSTSSDRDSLRATAFGELNFADFMDKESLATKILGRHVFTGLFSQQDRKLENRTWSLTGTDAAYGTLVKKPGMNSPDRQLAIASYIGPSLTNMTLGQNFGMVGINAPRITPSGSTVVRLFDSFYQPDPTVLDPWADWTDSRNQLLNNRDNPANYLGWKDSNVGLYNAELGDIEKLYLDAAKSQEKVTSQALVWQGFLFDGVIVPTIGWRSDEAKMRRVEAPKNADISQVNSDQYVLPDEYNVVKGNSTSWSVVAHLPKQIVEKMPLHTSVSIFYNESDNFRPDAGRVDVMGEPVGAATGSTKDYGFTITTLNNRLNLKVNWYKTTVKDDALTRWGGDYMLPAGPAWAFMFRRQSNSWDSIVTEGGNQYHVHYAPRIIRDAGTGLERPQTVAEAQAEWTNAVTAFDSVVDPLLLGWQNSSGQNFYDIWHIDRSGYLAGTNGWIQGYPPNGYTVTGDTESKGVEFEVTAEPVKGWNVSFNASKTTATRMNMAQSIRDRVDALWLAIRDSAAGDIRLWGNNYDPNETLRGKFEREMMAGYRLYVAQEGGQAPEIRPWRFNLVTNYTFQSSWMKNINIGGGYRWEDAAVIGYATKLNSSGELIYDISKPFKGPSEDHVDLWVGYERNITEKIKWRIQLNVRDVFTKKGLIPITTQPDGTPAAYRIQDGPTWTVTNSLSF